ncbi:RNA polymerase sigma factor [Cytophagaceae bacterium YF14B1]|uniref:RNA polymerase sigma factor n=1 Tax=Xanthocytophaga flava TaxID=3048013 RepID=A0AAE3QHL8_9BACT|nr:RNA polymerase sigma factor [Xanthocytophaga flavus]MDJ1479532.1 RNA polymerase sigma factor [Xanthocytophaga flavus]
MFEPIHTTLNQKEDSLHDDRLRWRSFKAGNRQSFSFLYEKYYSVLYNYGFHLIQDKDLVKDCLHDLFFYLWTHKEQVVEPNSVKSYLFTAFKRRLIDASQNKKRFLYNQPETDFEIIVSFEQEMVDEQTQAENIQKLQQAINQLTKRQREAIFLRYFENMSYEEIASVMECDINSLYVLMSRAVDSLRKSYCWPVFLLWISSLHPHHSI